MHFDWKKFLLLFHCWCFLSIFLCCSFGVFSQRFLWCCFAFWFCRLWDPDLDHTSWYVYWYGFLLVATVLAWPIGYCLTVSVVYIDNSNDSGRDICTVDEFIVVLLVVLHDSGISHNWSWTQVNKCLSNKYDRVSCTLAVDAEWIYGDLVLIMVFWVCLV